MITIYSPTWHDDGVVECYAILLGLVDTRNTLRASRAKLIDVREALRDAYMAFERHGDQGEDEAKHIALFDALGYVTEAMRGQPGCRTAIARALRCLESLKTGGQVIRS